MLSELFVAETVIFGIADLVALLGYWPQAYEEYELPTLSAARHRDLHYRHLRRLAFPLVVRG